MVYVLALPELFYTVQVIYRRNLEVIPLLMVATVWYLVILSVLSIIQSYRALLFQGRVAQSPSSGSGISLDKPVGKPAALPGPALRLPLSRAESR